MANLFIRTIPKPLNALALVSAISLLLKILVANDIPEAFRGAHDLGIVFEGLLASVLASYVFYLIVVHTKETSDRKLIAPYTKKWALRLVDDAASQLVDIGKESGIKLELSTLTSEQLTQAFGKFSPRSPAPLIINANMQRASWKEYLIFHRIKATKNIQKLISQLIYLPAEMVALITSIDDCGHFTTLDLLKNIEINNNDCDLFAKEFFEYCMRCKELNSYIQRYF